MFLERRSLLKSLGLAGLAGSWPLAKRTEAANSSRNLYQELGIQPVLNFRVTHTVIGGEADRLP